MLKREDDLVHVIRQYEEKIRLFEKRIEAIQGIDIDCEAKQNDLTYYDNLIDEARAWIVVRNEELKSVRDDLRNYIKTLLEEGASE